MLLLLTQRDVGAYPCVAPEEALDRLQLDVDGLNPDVSARVLPNSSTWPPSGPRVAGRVLLGEEDEDDDDEPPLRKPRLSRSRRCRSRRRPWPSAARGPRRLRILQAVEEARQFAAQEENELEDIQRRLIEGHIVSEEELEMLRAQQEGERARGRDVAQKRLSCYCVLNKTRQHTRITYSSRSCDAQSTAYGCKMPSSTSAANTSGECRRM